MNTITLSYEKKLQLIELVISAYAAAAMQAEETSTQAQAIDVSPNTQEQAKATKTKQPYVPGPLAQNRKFRDQIKKLVQSATK